MTIAEWAIMILVVIIGSFILGAVDEYREQRAFDRKYGKKNRGV